MNITREKIIRDLQAFADEPDSVEVSQNLASFKRFGKDIIFELVVNREKEGLHVIFNDQEMSYKQFFSREIAKLDIFANKIIESRSRSNNNYYEPFVDGKANLFTFENSFDGEEGDSLELLMKECYGILPTSTKVTFITADAGYGKTFLLKEFQYKQAKKFIDRKSNFLFWHVDMQGRQLVRLDEAIMRDLGELRIPGIYMSSVYYLIRNNLLVLSIDGFDELAAETGNTEALGALTNLVNQLKGRGIIIAASRRTFFDYNDYVKKIRILPKSLGENNDCVFNELKLNNWSKKENLKYLKDALFFNDRKDKPEYIYEDIFKLVGKKEKHAFLSIPFLFSRIIKGIIRYKNTPKEFLGKINSEGGVKNIIENFIKREVSDKWITKDGIPHLNKKQHFELLTSIAEDMWIQQKEALAMEDILLNTRILCEQWKITDTKRQDAIMRMIKMHALLVHYGNDAQMRKFDHPEYKNYFIANRFVKILEKLIEKPESSLHRLKLLLDNSQLPDTVGLYICNILKRNEDNIKNIIQILIKIISEEWTPSMLHVNIGTIFPFIINGFEPKETIIFGDTFENRISFSSLVFENKNIKNIEFHKANFTNIFFKNTKFKNVKFINCIFSDIKIDDESNNFNNVFIENSEISSVSKYSNGEEIEKGFAPIRIYEILKKFNIKYLDIEKDEINIKKEISNAKKLTYKFLNSFRRTSILYSENLENKFNLDFIKIKEMIIPLMLEHDILKESRKGWRLLHKIDDILKADNYNKTDKFEKFWCEINELK